MRYLTNILSKIIILLFSITSLSVIMQSSIQASSLSNSGIDYQNYINHRPWLSDMNNNLIYTKEQPIQKDGTIHYKITGNRKFNKVFKNAVNNWNRLHVIKLKQVHKNNKTATINLHGNYQNEYLPEREALGMTHTQSNTYGISKLKHMIAYAKDTKVNLDYNHVINLPLSMQEFVATHELGHALGFDDEYKDTDKDNIMYYSSNNTYHTVHFNQKDIDTLNYYYKNY